MSSKNKKPPFRRLRGYAFDPSLSLQIGTVQTNNITYKVEWEELDKRSKNSESTYPAGEYIEIVDYDPASELFYPPIDLNERYLLAQDGLDPSVSNPQFHQQMVYAVVMTTIKNFEKALGRKIQWGEHEYYRTVRGKRKTGYQFVGRLRIYPHALRQANAYYNPQKKSLLFGYFPAAPANPNLQLPGGTVFACLSHDIIAHETTHAILDGLHRRYIEATHPDTRAFHEAFADVIALFQHFTFSDVLKHQISKTRGDLAAQNLLGQLAEEFGKAVGSYGSLRDAIGYTDENGKWIPHQPDPQEYQNVTGFHERGSILVAAIFDAFLTIYKERIRSVLRIATGGSGVLPDGELHPDMVDNLAGTASKVASQVLKICVRALDYCPPLDITFGDYLRALITADKDMVADDEMDYRIAFIEAFQKRGIFPKGLKSMSVEALCHEENPQSGIPEELSEILIQFLRDFKNELGYEQKRDVIHAITKEFIGGGPIAKAGFHDRLRLKSLKQGSVKKFSELTGMHFPDTEKKCNEQGLGFSRGAATFQVNNLWLASRVTPEGKIINHVVATLMQQRGVFVEADENNFKVTGHFVPGQKTPKEKNAFIYRGGCTLIFDLDSLCLKYAIKKDIMDRDRMEQQYRYIYQLDENAAGSTYFDDRTLSSLSGPFAFMHSFPHNL